MYRGGYQIERIARRILLSIAVMGTTTPGRADLVGHWSLNGTLENAVQSVPRASLFLLDDGAATPALDAPDFVAGPSPRGNALALHFRGPSDPDGNGQHDGDFVTLYEDELGLAPVDETTSWSLTGWFRIDPDPQFSTAAGRSGEAGLFVNGEVESGLQHQLGLSLAESNAGSYHLQSHAGGEVQPVDSNLIVDVSKWYFVAQVSDGPNNQLTVRLWDESGPANLNQHAVVGSATPLWLERVFEMEIGWNPCCSDQLFDGAMADIRIFNHALSESELLELAFPSGMVLGDFDANGLLEEQDLNALSAAIRAQDSSPRYDVNHDGHVNSLDRTVWVEELKQTWLGDANLDGEFNSGDLVQVFQAGEYEDVFSLNSDWSDGDWSGDGEFTSFDFVVAFQGGGFEQGPRAGRMAVVPEPTAATYGLLAAGLFSFLHRRFVKLD